MNFSALRKDHRDILTVMLYHDESSSDSSDKEDLDVLFVVAAFGERRILNKKLNIAGPFMSTELFGVENARLRFKAISSQSAGHSGFFVAIFVMT